jgi:sulfatase modifying factor 1
VLTDSNYPASVSSFRLDSFEVVVGRFQRFVNAWVDGFRPSAGAGKHAHLNAGRGLVETGGGYERGWDENWADNLATTAADWDANLSCEPSYSTWPASTLRPQTCVTWYEAYAFCIWDGGFLPSEAERNYAASGGGAQRQYPWGYAVPSAEAALAAYGCYYNGSGTCSGVANIALVGSIPAGDGMFGQSDLGGSVWEWNLDWYSTSYSSASCDNCVDSSSSQHRVRRGGSFRYSDESLASAFRSRDAPMNRRFDGGFRCARAP